MDNICRSTMMDIRTNLLTDRPSQHNSFIACRALITQNKIAEHSIKQHFFLCSDETHYCPGV